MSRKGSENWGTAGAILLTVPEIPLDPFSVRFAA